MCLQFLDSPDYTLRAIILHVGMLSYGHYRAIVRGDDGSWRKCDDERITFVKEAAVFPSQRDASIYKQAYLLFYERTDEA